MRGELKDATNRVENLLNQIDTQASKIKDLEKQIEGLKGTGETANWKTYRNEKYGYEIKYPENWYSYTLNPADVFFQPKEEKLEAIPGPHADAFEIEIIPISTDTTLSQAIQKVFERKNIKGVNFNQENIKIGGISGLRIETVCEGVGCGAPEWLVIKNNYLYHFDSNLGYSETFNQILSTFKFIE